MTNGQKKIKVAFVLGALNRGGAESLILDICRYVDKTPFELVCIYRKEGNLSEEFHATSARLIHVPKKGSMFSYMLHLRRLIKAENIDIVHSQTASNTLVLGISLLGCGKKIVTTIHGFSFLNANALYKSIVFRISHKVVFVSNYQRALYLKNSNIQDNSLVIYNGVDSTKFEVRYDEPEIFQSTNHTLKLCVVGNIRKARTYEVIIKALHRLPSYLHDNIAVYIIGNTPIEEQYLLDLYISLCKQYDLENIVHFVGSRGDIPAILQYSDLYIMSSIETFGISIVEAMISGLPVIVNDFDVMKEITEEGQLSILYATGDAEDLSKKLLHVLGNIEYYKEQAQSRKEYVKSKYSIENCIKNLMHLYSDILWKN